MQVMSPELREKSIYVKKYVVCIYYTKINWKLEERKVSLNIQCTQKPGNGGEAYLSFCLEG